MTTTPHETLDRRMWGIDWKERLASLAELDDTVRVEVRADKNGRVLCTARADRLHVVDVAIATSCLSTWGTSIEEAVDKLWLAYAYPSRENFYPRWVEVRRTYDESDGKCETTGRHWWDGREWCRLPERREERDADHQDL